MGFYLGCAIGVVTVALFIRYVTAFRFVMALVFAAGALFGTFGGFMLAWPVRDSIPPEAGAVIGAVAWLVVTVFSCRRDARRSAASSPSPRQS